MDLWIRSQDDGLYKIVGFKPPLCCNDTKPDEKYAIIGICYEYRMIELGIYKAKERALEVLNNITKIISNADDNGRTTYVYEMPKE